MKLSIIIINYKTVRLTAQCIEGILSYPPKCSHEIIVVNNSPDDKCFEVLRERVLSRTDVPIALVSAPGNIGFSAGNNLGLEHASGEYALFLNADTVVFPDSIQPLVDYLDTNADVGLVGPKILNPDKSTQLSCFRFPNTFFYPLYRRTILANTQKGQDWLKWFKMDDFDRSYTREVDWLLGACILARMSAVQEIGTLDDRFFLFLEDTDWAYRFWLGGWKVVYHSKGRIVHHIERASDDNNFIKALQKKTAWIHLASWLKYYKKHMWRKPDYPRAQSTR
ncbi:MAG: glycosyltransferase family 2 protein [Patescibacteria group bacterium]